MSKVTRRRFLGTSAAGAVLAAAPASAKPPSTPKKVALPTRPLGGTGVRVPIIGLGTVALGNLGTEKEAAALLNRAIDLGVTYIDTAPGSTRQAIITGYSRAQRYLAGVLRERRKEVFIVTKCLETDGARTIELLRRNLKELGIEQADLTYTHSIGHAVYEFDDLVGAKGPMAMLESARRDGLTRFLGITGHNRPEKFARVLQRRNIDVMMNAVNIVDRHTYAFEDVVWPIARKQNVGLVGMKVFGGGIRSCKIPEELRQPSLRYVLGIPNLACAVIGMGSVKELEQNVEWAASFKPIQRDELRDLTKRTVGLAREWGAHLDRLDSKGERERPLVNT